MKNIEQLADQCSSWTAHRKAQRIENLVDQTLKTDHAEEAQDVESKVSYWTDDESAANTLGAEIGRISKILNGMRDAAGRSPDGRLLAILATEAENLLALAIGYDAAPRQIPTSMKRSSHGNPIVVPDTTGWSQEKQIEASQMRALRGRE